MLVQVYWAGPIAGGLLAALLYCVVLDLVGRKHETKASSDYDGYAEGRWAPKSDGAVNSAYSIGEDAL